MHGIEGLGDFNLGVEEVAINARRSWERNGKKNGWRGVDMFGDISQDDYAGLLTLDLKESVGVSCPDQTEQSPPRWEKDRS